MSGKQFLTQMGIIKFKSYNLIFNKHKQIFLFILTFLMTLIYLAIDIVN